MLMARKEVRTLDREMVRSQRKELEELRCTVEIQNKNEEELRRQVGSLKVDKEKLLIEISGLN